MKSIFLVSILAIVTALPVHAQIKPHRLISDGMVLQREMSIPIFGNGARPSIPLEITFRGQTFQHIATAEGSWEVMLPAQQPGGPFEMVIRQADETVTLRNVYVGDVWIASGQSNMDMAMRMAWPLYEHEIATAQNPEIRHFWVPKLADFNQAQGNLSGGQWVPISPEHNARLSAVAFFFSKHIHQTQHVPVGIITASLGGSPAEAWMSEQAISGWPAYYEEAILYRNQALVDSINDADRVRKSAWYEALNHDDLGLRSALPWHHPNIDHSGWPTMTVPGTWSDAIASGALSGIADQFVMGMNTPADVGASGNQASRTPLNGVMWVRRDIYLDEAPSPGEQILLNLGAIVDADTVFVNGHYAGHTTYRHPPRWYRLPEGLLQKGKNTIAIRIFNEAGFGGFVLDKPYELTIGSGENQRRYALDGNWHFRLGAQASAALGPPTNVIRKPMGLYNAMIAPLTRFPITGTIWYQGESNAGRSEEYRTLFPDLIRDWRRHWGQGDFPFLFVQLANYMAITDNPSEAGSWVLMREAQFMTTKMVPNTAAALAIDIGESFDVHPLNKKDVGDRLALAARRLAYNEDVAFSGPVFRQATVQGNHMILEFDGVHGGLLAGRPETGALYGVVPGSEGSAPDQHRVQHVGGFAVAGSDGRFHWADAVIEADRVVVWSDQVTQPVSVRYAWSNNPVRANLYNRAGLPAVPFRYPVE